MIVHTSNLRDCNAPPENTLRNWVHLPMIKLILRLANPEYLCHKDKTSECEAHSGSVKSSLE